jgi:hypothetical protein
MEENNNCIHSIMVIHMVIVTNIIYGVYKTYQILPSDINTTKTVRERPRVPTLLTLSNFILSHS